MIRPTFYCDICKKPSTRALKVEFHLTAFTIDSGKKITGPPAARIIQVSEVCSVECMVIRLTDAAGRLLVGTPQETKEDRCETGTA